MLGGLGQTSLVGSKENLRGPTTVSVAVVVFLFFSALEENGKTMARASRSSTLSGLVMRIGLRKKRNMLVSSYFPGIVVWFMLSLFLWQLSQNAMLFCWSLIRRSACAEACG